MSALSVALRARQPPSNPYHGKFIYIYKHLRTNQIIYSLNRDIHREKTENGLLKQLTFYGKKTVPTKIRKDHWRPFATVTFPEPAQGLRAYQYLREYRMVRDHTWTFAPTEADLRKAERQARAKEARELEEEEDPETAEDKDKVKHEYTDSTLSHYTRWPLKWERAKLLMDHRATSVADLSHIISRQMNFTGEVRSARERIKRETLWAKIKKLAATDPVELKKLEDERATLESNIAASKANLASNANHQVRFEANRTNNKRQRRVHIITAELNKFRKASEAVAFAEGKDVPESQRIKWSKSLKYIVQQFTPNRQVISTYDLEAAKALKEAKDLARPCNWPSKKTMDVLPGERQKKPKAVTRRDRIALKHWAPERDIRKSQGVPSEGVLIQWAYLPDAQYAQEWHENVYHEQMPDPKIERVDRNIDNIIRMSQENAAREAQERV